MGRSGLFLFHENVVGIMKNIYEVYLIQCFFNFELLIRFTGPQGCTPGKEGALLLRTMQMYVIICRKTPGQETLTWWRIDFHRKTHFQELYLSLNVGICSDSVSGYREKRIIAN